MAFGIIRVRKLHAGDIASTELHNARLYKPGMVPENIRVGSEYSFDAQLYDESAGSLQDTIDNRFRENKVTGIKSNSIHALEYVCAISDKKAWEKYDFQGFTFNTVKWLEQRHGAGSVVAHYIHQDESNPHVHIVVVPLKEKKIHWKNQKGEGVRTEVRLNAKEFIDGRDKLRALQDDWHNHLIKRYGTGQHSSFGIDLFRGTLKEHQHREYTKHTDHKIALLNEEIEKANNLAVKYHKMAVMESLMAEKLEKEKAFKIQQNIEQEKKKENWHLRGTRGMKF